MKSGELDQDGIETLLLLLLDPECEGQSGLVNTEKLLSGEEGMKYEQLDAADHVLSKFRVLPKHAFVLSGEDDRLVTTHHADLTAKPWEILEDRTEVVLPKWGSGEVQWSCMKRLSRPPPGVATWGRAKAWYLRTVWVADPVVGWRWQRRRVVAFSNSGAPMPVKYALTRAEDPASYADGTNAVIDCSVVEDVLRANSVRADVSAGATISFALDEDAYQDFFRMRDGPRDTPTGRRNPIVHWVGRHLRRMRSGKVISVKDHTRGTETLDMNGTSVALTMQKGAYPWLEERK